MRCCFLLKMYCNRTGNIIPLNESSIRFVQYKGLNHLALCVLMANADRGG